MRATNMKKFQHSILGGTFDHLHKGHKYIIDRVFKSSSKVTLGITGQNFVKNKVLSAAIESFDDRKKTLENYLTKRDFQNKTKIITLNDIYGNSVDEKNIDALFVSQPGLINANLINEERAKNNFPHLSIVNVPLKKGVDGNVISSTRIRMGEIDRNGNPYANIFKESKELILPISLRQNLKKPFGEIIKNTDDLSFLNNKFVIAVGDIVTASLIQKGITPNISFFDLKTKRQDITDKNVLNSLPVPETTLANKQGTINSKTSMFILDAIYRSVKTNAKIAIKITGEEDLIALPSILFAPLNSYVIYGRRGYGMYKVVVTEKNKEEIKRKYLEKFEKK